MLNYRIIIKAPCCPRLDDSRFDLEVKMLPTGYHGNLDGSNFTICYDNRGSNSYLVIITLESLEIVKTVLEAVRRITNNNGARWIVVNSRGEIVSHASDGI